jgi:orotate phosphoribosyltransferase
MTGRLAQRPALAESAAGQNAGRHPLSAATRQYRIYWKSMESSRPPTDTFRARAFEIIKERSFKFGNFILVSGRTSQYYLDMKPTMFDPEGGNLLARLVLDRIAELKPDYVGGLEMGAVPLIASVTVLSHEAGRPVRGFFVRKGAKDHGTKKLVDGIANGALRDKNVVILEDVTTKGMSAMQAVSAARAEGAAVALVLSIVDREEGAAEFFKKEGLPFDFLFRASEFRAG